MKYKCPCCGNKTIPLLRKYFMTPFSKVKCKKCASTIRLSLFVTICVSSLQYISTLYFAYLIFINQSMIYVIMLIFVWLTFDVIHMYIPLHCQDTTKGDEKQ
jgi:hypothetical protein